MALFIHECGKRYLQTVTDDPPPPCKLMVCEQCLEPMPVCNDTARAFAYEGLGDFSFRRLIPPTFTARTSVIAA